MGTTAVSLKVWYDKKRDCYSTNAAMIYAKKHGLRTCDAAIILASLVNDRLVEDGRFASMEYASPGGVLWTIPL